jgi:hypothetical protein
MMPTAKYCFKKSKMPRKISQQTLCIRSFTQKRNFQCALDNDLSVTHVFIMQIFKKLHSKHPPLPPQHCAGGGVVVILFSIKPWHWLWLLSRED